MRRSAQGLLLFALLMDAACSSRPGTSEQEKAADLKPQSAHAGTTAPASSAPAGLKFTAPAGWVQETPASSMRKAQYVLPRVEGDGEDAELAVFFFKGEGGSVQANIERWIGQFTRPDGSPATDAAKTTHKEIHGIPVTIVDVSGTYMSASGPMLSEVKQKPGFRMLAAVAETGEGPWFFKLAGPAATVAKWEPSFDQFLDSIQP